MNSQCFICNKHAGEVAQPPGGYIYEDEHWRVCHGPADGSDLGTLIVESRRHFLDFTEMNSGEQVSYGELLHRLYIALKQVLPAERIYSVVLLEGVPHFHNWLIPRLTDSPEHSISLLAKDASCDLDAAAALSARLRHILSGKNS